MCEGEGGGVYCIVHEYVCVCGGGGYVADEERIQLTKKAALS